ncbi:MAG TPA: Asp-tRNA(Asn)/Glu-tRNA(Gln) amidotransferase subunit GatA [Candidatus Paceibacterota bacterium]|nr:Asp-tRNA(Asn)/Glu-tRNA(Gln) amidotransferase subunit GatA [Candidatus Paceibacterota bacterium]
MAETKYKTIQEAQEALEKRQVTSEELTQECLDLIEEKDGELHAFLEVFDDAILQAKAADARRAAGETGPLLGIPLALKDNILVQGHVASAASRILTSHRAVYDATVVAKLKVAGAVIVGRTNLDEFAMGVSTENSAFGTTTNPHDPTRVAGGSSGGSAAAVATGMVYAALGSDTGGSVRQPSALCGTVGLKPTYGSVSRYGLIALASSFDVIGPITRSVADAETMLHVIAGKDSMDATSIDASDYDPVAPEVKTIGVPRKFLDEYKLRPEVAEVFENALKRLKSLGYSLIDIELTNFGYSVPTYYVILPAEASSNLARFDGVRYGLHADGENMVDDYGKTRGAGFGPEPRRRIVLGTYVLSSGYYDAYYNKANSVRALITKDFINALSKCDVIAMPTSVGPAFKIGEKSNDPVQMYLEDLFTGAANLTGLPAISVPDGTVREGGVELPLGLQLIAPHMGEARLFAVGKRFADEV